MPILQEVVMNWKFVFPYISSQCDQYLEQLSRAKHVIFEQVTVFRQENSTNLIHFLVDFDVLAQMEFNLRKIS